jgi:hypothetical protein
MPGDYFRVIYLCIDLFGTVVIWREHIKPRLLQWPTSNAVELACPHRGDWPTHTEWTGQHHRVDWPTSPSGLANISEWTGLPTREGDWPAQVEVGLACLTEWMDAE